MASWPDTLFLHQPRALDTHRKEGETNTCRRIVRMHRAHMLNVHRARLLAAAPAEDDSRILCAVVASVMSLMLLCGLLSVVPSSRAFGVTRTYVVVGLGAILLLLMLAAWLVAPWMGATAQRRAPAPAPASLRQMCACGIGDAAALGALPTFPYEPPEPPRSSEARRSCAVCLEDVRAGEMVRKLPTCGHLFHVSCVDAWLRSHPTCPICRCELPTRGVVVTKATAAAGVSAQAPDALPPV